MNPDYQITLVLIILLAVRLLWSEGWLVGKNILGRSVTECPWSHLFLIAGAVHFVSLCSNSCRIEFGVFREISNNGVTISVAYLSFFAIVFAINGLISRKLLHAVAQNDGTYKKSEQAYMRVLYCTIFLFLFNTTQVFDLVITVRATVVLFATSQFHFFSVQMLGLFSKASTDVDISEHRKDLNEINEAAVSSHEDNEKAMAEMDSD